MATRFYKKNKTRNIRDSKWQLDPTRKNKKKQKRQWWQIESTRKIKKEAQETVVETWFYKEQQKET